MHETSKQLDEHKDKLTEDDVKEIEAARDELKTAAESDDKAKIEAALQTFQTKAQKLGEILYKEQQAEAGAAGGAPEGSGPAEPAGDASKDEPVDADFEVKS